MVASSSSVARAWPSNWFVAIDWLLHVFRSLLPATFLKAFSSTCGVTVSTGRGENQLDENGNPLPIEETGSKVDDATPDEVQSQAASRILEDRLPENAAHAAEGKATKGGKEVVRRGTKTQGKAQMKQKSLKSKKNEISAKVTKILEQSSSGEPVHHGTSAEVKNQKQDYKSPMKSTEEECPKERDDEQQIIMLSETGSMEDDCKDEFNDAENTSINAEASLICSYVQQDSDAVDGTFLAESFQMIPEERLLSSRSQSRKKRRKGKQNRSQNSKPDSTSVKVSTSTGTTVSTNDPVIDSSSSVLPVNVSPTNPVKSVSFCCHQISNVHQKPSARVPPSRSTAVDHGLNSRVVSCVLGEKSSYELGEKTVDGLSIVEDKRIDEEKFYNVEDDEVVNVSLSVEMRSDSSNTFIVDRRSGPDLETSQSFKNDLAEGLSTEVQEILPEMQPCVTVQASVCVCPLSSSRKQSTLIGQQSRVKPQSTVNPFSVLTYSTSVKPLHTVNQTLHSAPQTRIRIEPVSGAKPKFNQPPRLKPRSLVNPVNPLRVDQSLQTRVRLQPRFDPVSSSTDLPKPMPNDSPDTRTSTITDPNPTFRILRRRPGTSTSLAKHSDSSTVETKHSVTTTEQCSNSCYGNVCHSDCSPSVAKTTVCSESSHHDNVATTTKRSDVAKKPQNSRLSDRKIFDHSSIPESIRSSTPGSSIDAESRSGERESGSRVGSSTCDRLPSSGSRTSPKNMRTIIGHRTNLSSCQVAENAVTFDLVRAQQYMRAEFLKTMELKRRGGNVKFLKL